MFGTTYLSLSILALAFLFFSWHEFMEMIHQIKDRWYQVKPCKVWCETPGFLIQFTEYEAKQCIQKCYKLSVIPPVVNYFCKEIDSIIWINVSETDFCDYYIQANKYSVQRAVELRWFNGIKGKIKSYW